MQTNPKLKLVKCIGTLFIVSALSACSTVAKTPAWVNNPHSEYAASTYLVAVGSGEDQDVAADRALANLAKQFSVTVAENTSDKSSATIDSSQADGLPHNQQEVSRLLTTQVNEVVEGAKIANYWHNDQGMVYALATLDKPAARQRLLSLIRGSDQQIQQLVQHASTTATNPVSALRALQQARTLAQVRDQANQRLMIIGDGIGVKLGQTSADIDNLTRSALATLKVQAVSESTLLKAELEQALTTLGVTLVASSNLQFIGLMDVAKPQRKQGWYWLRGAYELSVVDNGYTLAKQRWPIKVSAQEENMLEQRARSQVNLNMAKYVYQLLASQN